MAPGESVGGFQILRRGDLHGFDQAGKIWRVAGERFYHGVAELLAAIVPIPFFQFEWRKLHVRGEDVLAFRSERRIEERGNGDIEIRGGRESAVLGGVEGALEVVDVRADVDAARESFDEAIGGNGVSERGEGREIVEGEVNFGDGAVRTEILDAQGERGIELRRVDEMEEGPLGIDAGDDRVGGGFFAVGEDEAGDR